jgi:ATP-dependent protease ClpP protease subunit
MYIVNINTQKKEASIRLYGEIGRKVDGDVFARDLLSLDGKADVVNLHINSPGGDVVQGLSIVSAILSMKAYIHAKVEGIAASMAAVIAVSADKVTMQDFSKLMIHDPFFSNTNPDKLSDKQRKCLNSLTDTLRIILSRRGKSREDIARLMTDETWFSAEEAKQSGLADEVVRTERKEQFATLTTDEILSRIADEYQTNNNDMDYKKIAAELGLPESATEADILAAIQTDKKEKEAQRKAALDDLLARGVASGLVTEKNQADMTKLGEANADLLKSLIENSEASAAEKVETTKEEGKKPAAKTEGYTRLSEALEALKKQGGAATGVETKTFDWYQKNDPVALATLEQRDPKLFNKLLNDYENSI